MTLMSANESPNEFKLEAVASDCIQSVKFGPHSSQYLVSASWDGSVRLHDISSNALRTKYTHSAPVLDCAFQVPIFSAASLMLICSKSRTHIMSGAVVSTHNSRCLI